MNNTKTLTAIAAVLMAATLVVGGILGATTSTALAYKKKGQENSKNGNTITLEKCQNKGSASGFDTAVDQECENLICTHPGSNATCVSESSGAAAVGGGGTGGGGGGVAGCTVGANAIVLDTGARVCVTLPTPLVFPVNGACASPLVAVHLGTIDICATVVANL